MNAGVTMNTGGHVAKHQPGKSPEVMIPQKATGDVKANDLKGVAKASPLFKEIEKKVEPKSKVEEKRVIAENTTKVAPVKKAPAKEDKTIGKRHTDDKK